MGSLSRNKGAGYERHVAEVIRSYGFDCARNARNGLSTEDLAHAIPGVWLECKKRERLNIWEALEQAEQGSSGGLWVVNGDTANRPTPVVVFSRNRERDYAALPLTDLLVYMGGEKHG